MSTLVDELKKKRRIFVLFFIILAAIYGLVFWQGETKLTEQQLQYFKLGWRLSVAVLSLWFGYAIGLKWHIVWFVSLLAILPVMSWLVIIYLLYRSGSMLIEAKEAQKGNNARVAARAKGGKKQVRKRK